MCCHDHTYTLAHSPTPDVAHVIKCSQWCTHGNCSCDSMLGDRSSVFAEVDSYTEWVGSRSRTRRPTSAQSAHHASSSPRTCDAAESRGNGLVHSHLPTFAYFVSSQMVLPMFDAMTLHSCVAIHPQVHTPDLLFHGR